VPTAAQITTFLDDVPGNPWVRGAPLAEDVVIRAYDPTWPARFAALAGAIHGALGPAALAVDHVGSTSVPGLAAKDVIDIDLTVADNGDEASYVPLLEPLGYWLCVREEAWFGHRCLRLDAPRVNLHVWAPDSPEAVRHQLFRAWLRTHDEDRRVYEDAKRAAVPGGGLVEDYNARKQPVIREIYARIFAAAGLTAAPDDKDGTS
jgi:GrpB-like predicted nucleotidyltransferase (UPF0157 family)